MDELIEDYLTALPKVPPLNYGGSDLKGIKDFYIMEEE